MLSDQLVRSTIFIVLKLSDMVSNLDAAGVTIKMAIRNDGHFFSEDSVR